MGSQRAALGQPFFIREGAVNVKADCHIHMVLDGLYWRAAIDRHREKPDENWICRVLEEYQRKGFSYLRDGGDRWGVGKRARELAENYGIRYRTPLAPLCKAGHYGAFIGRTYDSMGEFARMVRQIRENGGDFIKIMISGLMDFDRAGVLTEGGLSPEEIRELIHIAHEEGLSVMAHANGARTIEAAAEAGVDSVEHGAYADDAALYAMAENGVIWVPTLSTVGNLRGKGRFREEAVEEILRGAMDRVRIFARMGGLIAPGSDAGAWAVPHGCRTEEALLKQALGDGAEEALNRGIRAVMERF